MVRLNKQERQQAQINLTDTSSEFKKWLDSWRWSNIKLMWNQEHSRVLGNYHSNTEMIKSKFR